MTEYDLSPGAARARMEKLHKTARWISQVDPHTLQNPFTPATPAPVTFTSLLQDEKSRPHRPNHTRDRVREGDSGYEKNWSKDRPRDKQRGRKESRDRKSRGWDSDDSSVDDDNDSYQATIKFRTRRSKYHNVITPPAEVYEQNRYQLSQTSLDQSHSAPPTSVYGNYRQTPPTPRTQYSTVTYLTYPSANGDYASEAQTSLQQQQPQVSQVYLPSKSSGHLPQPQPAPPPPLQATSTNRGNPPSAHLDLPPRSVIPQTNGYPLALQPYFSSKHQPYYQHAPSPHTAPWSGYSTIPFASGYPSTTIGPTTALASTYPVPPIFYQIPAPASTPVPIPSLPYAGPIPSLKEKPKPLIKRLFTTLTGPGFNKVTSDTPVAGYTPGNSAEYVVPGAKSGVPQDSRVRALYTPPAQSVRYKGRTQQRDKDRRPPDRERSWAATWLGDIEKVGKPCYDIYDSSMAQDNDSEWELVSVEGRWKEDRERTHTRAMRERKRGHDGQLSYNTVPTPSPIWG